MLNVIGASDHLKGLAASSLGVAEHTSRRMTLMPRREEGV